MQGDKKVLYKKRHDGNLQLWSVWVEERIIDGSKCGVVVVEYGVCKLQKTEKIVASGKNLGKSNETTSIEQALKEAKSLWKKQKAKGYVESVEEALAGRVDDQVVVGGIDVMLAHNYATFCCDINNNIIENIEHKQHIKFPALFQPKLDGVRCIAIIRNKKCTLWTRNRKLITSVPHINKALEDMDLPDLILDGELYNHELKDDFEKLVSLVKQTNQVDPNSQLVQYWIYDLVNNKSQIDRLNELSSLIKENDAIKICPTNSVSYDWELLEIVKRYVLQGYEGGIVRNKDAFYEHKRSFNLQKIKFFQEEEFMIVDVVEGEGTYKGCAIFLCQINCNSADELKAHSCDIKIFEVKMKGSIEKLKEIYRNKDDYIGKKLTVQFQNFTKRGIPRFPVGKQVRDYE